VAVAGSVDPLIGVCGNPLFIAATPADIEAARASIGRCEPHMCRICQGVHTPVEDALVLPRACLPNVHCVDRQRNTTRRILRDSRLLGPSIYMSIPLRATGEPVSALLDQAMSGS
jgi:hypothetical protein